MGIPFLYCSVTSLLLDTVDLATNQKRCLSLPTQLTILTLWISTLHHLVHLSLKLIFRPVKHIHRLLLRLCSIQTELSLCTWALLLSNICPGLAQHSPVVAEWKLGSGIILRATEHPKRLKRDTAPHLLKWLKRLKRFV